MTPLATRLSEKIDAPRFDASCALEETLLLKLGFPFIPYECWRWTGARCTTRGEPRPEIRLGGRGSPVTTVLRVMLSLLDGVPLTERVGQVARHTCDHVWCVNPFHGIWGTHAENTQDRTERQPESFKRKASRAS